MRFKRLIYIVSTCGILAIAAAANWPQWRGPSRDGISKETGLLQAWPTEGPKLLWQKDGLGDGYSTPSIVGDRIFLINNKGLDDEFVQCRSVKDGAQLWQTHIGKVGEPKQNPNYPGARSTPTVDGNMLYALGSDGDLACIDTAKGEIRWKKNLQTDFGGAIGKWAYAESPLIDGNAVVVTPGGKDATLVALNKKTGEIVQKYASPDEDKAGYSSIIIVEAAGVRQYVQFLGKGLVGFDAKTGKFLWRYDHTATKSPANIATPIAADNCIYSGTKYAGAGLVRLASAGGQIKAEEVYFDKKLITAIGGAILLGDYLYGSNNEQFMCLNFKTGDSKWTKPRTMAPSSLCFANGRLYAHAEANNELALIEPTPDGYQEHGRFTPPNTPENPQGGKAWTYPVVANGRLYIHDWGTLWCYDVKAEGAPRAATRPTRPARN
jgi:outer membrane protein assembly factor BamB